MLRACQNGTLYMLYKDVAVEEIKRLFRMASIESDIWTVFVYAAAVGLLTLVVPVAAQGLVTIVSFGTVIQPLYVLGVALFLLMAANAVFRILQIILIENIQQKLFVHTGLRLAARYPRLKMSDLQYYRGTELGNRFFDIVMIQKTTSVVLLGGIGLVLQATFGMILMAVYHPFLLIFDIFYLIALFVVVWIPFHRAKESALSESTEKYKVAGWLEEIMRLPVLFRFRQHADYAFDRADSAIADYLCARQRHFRHLMQHILGFYSIQAVANTILLVLGGFLVINNQMTLGQLVASEIVVMALGSSVSQLGRYLESFYDLSASAKKLDFLLSFPVDEEQGNRYRKKTMLQSAPDILLESVRLKGPEEHPINLSVSQGGKAVIYSEQAARSHCLADVLMGFSKPYEGLIRYNGLSIVDYSREVLRDNILLLRDVEIFDGSILDNIRIGTPVAEEKIVHLLNETGLNTELAKNSQSIYEEKSCLDHVLSDIDAKKLMIIRAILGSPSMVVMDHFMDSLPLSEVKKLLILLQSLKVTLIVITSRKKITELFDNECSL